MSRQADPRDRNVQQKLQEILWLTMSEAAAYLQIRPRTLAKWTREGSVKGYPLHGTKRITWRFRREDLDAAMGYVTASAPSVVLSSPASSVALH